SSRASIAFPPRGAPKRTAATRGDGRLRWRTCRSMSRSSVRSSNVAKAAPIFAALGDEMRLQLLGRLGSSGPQSITSLTTGTDVTRQAITKHLNVLASAGLVRDLRTGRERIWEL